MAEINRSELHQAVIRRSGGDLEALLHALDADGSITVVDDPAPETLEQENPETGETETVEVPYAPGPEITIKVDADEAAAASADDSADVAGDDLNATQGAIDLADEESVDLSQVTGTGEGGRITKSDVDAFLDARDAGA
jgi:pyruvate/2-oxoglutarate dehydrogenase complex dihydrolipoamide acyltransferase (E2) component